MTQPVNLIIRQGQSVYQVLPATGLETAGRKLVAHIRDATAAPTVICILSSDGPANRLLEFVDGGIAVTIGASIVQAWPVNARRVEWVYDVHSYSESDAEDSITTHAGTAIVYGTPTRPADVTPSELMPSGDARYTRFDAAQDLGPSGRAQAQLNILGEEYSPGGGGGAAAWGGITGTLSAQTDLQSALDLRAPTASPTLTGTPAAPTATSGTSTTQIATTAFVGSAVSTHAGATDPHGDRAFATSAVSTHSALTTGAHGITAAGAALLDDADAAAQRTTLGLGTAATQASGAFEASGAVSTHNAVTTAHGISAFGATLVDDASASAARGTLGLGTASTTAATDYATAAQGTDDRTASGLRTASTVVSISSATAPSSGQVLTATSTTAATWQTPSGGGGSPAGSTGELQYNNAGALGAVAGSSVDLANGRVGFGTGSPAAVLHAVADSASEVALIAQAASGATANIQQWRNSSGTVLGYINAAGEFVGILTRGNGYLDLNDGWSHTIGITISGATYVAIRGGPHGWYSQFFEAHAESASYGVRHRSYAGETEQHFGGATCSGDAVAERVSVRGHDAKPSASTNLIGGDLYLVGGAGASASSGNAHGGNVYLRGGTKYGTGHNGYLIADNLPTSASGLPTGAIWNDAGTLKVA